MKKKVLFCDCGKKLPKGTKSVQIHTIPLSKAMLNYITINSGQSEKIFRYALSKPFSGSSGNPEEAETRLRSIADQSYDLLGQLQKMEKLNSIGKLSAAEKSEYQNIVRLVGLMIHLLTDQKFSDKEMMDGLLKRYSKFASKEGIAVAGLND